MSLKTETVIKLPNNTLTFHTPNDFLLKRATELLESEPETIAWINLMSESETLWDIGANVGTYSIYAAIVKNIKTVAFEPEASNFLILSRNIRTNNCFDLVTAYPIAVGTEDTFTKLYLARELEGWACNSVGENIDTYLKPRKKVIEQGSICFGVDEIAQKIGVLPSHIKIDIDGLELEVLKSAINTISNMQVKSLLVELNPNIDEHMQAIKILQGKGFGYHPQMAEETKIKTGVFIDMNNFIFHREPAVLENIYNEYKRTIS